MYSLRLHMPNAFISLLVDNTTELSLTGKRNAIHSLVNEFISVIIDNRYNKKTRSRWLKTSMRQHITGDFLFLDCDTIIARDLSSLDTTKMNLAAVLNENTNLLDLARYNPDYLKNMQNEDKKNGFSSTVNLNVYYNSGLIFCRDSTIGYDFYKEWHRLWLFCSERGIVTDQQSFNQTNYIMGNIISELDGIWNCQILADGGMRYFHKANIIHYYNSIIVENPYLLGSNIILEKIKKNCCIDQDIKDMLAKPKDLFLPNSRMVLMDIPMHKFNKSIIYTVAKLLFYTKFGAAIDSILWLIYRKTIRPLRKKLSKK